LFWSAAKLSEEGGFKMKRILVLLMALVLVMAMRMDVQAAKKVPVNTQNTEISTPGGSVAPVQSTNDSVMVPMLPKGFILLEVVLDYSSMSPNSLKSGDGAYVQIDEGDVTKPVYPWTWWNRVGSTTAQERKKETRPIASERNIGLTTKRNILLPEGKNYTVRAIYQESLPSGIYAYTTDPKDIYITGGYTGGEGTINTATETPSITIQIKPD
jgi:hypothetical protein